MRRICWNDLLIAASLVRLGQELGTDSVLARAVADLVCLITAFRLPTN
jgi:hypothetical protein